MMRCHCGPFRVAVFAAGVIFLTAARCAAQILAFGEWYGTYESVNRYEREDTETGSSQRSHFQDILSENRISLRNVGAYMYHPRLMTFSLGGNIGLSQDWSRGTGRNETSQGTLWGYDFSAGVLPERPLSLSLFANRNQSLFSGGVAGRIDVLGENRGATLFARHLYLPSRLAFSQEIRESESKSGGVVSRSEQQRNVVRYEGQRGWTDSEMNISYEFSDFTDKVFSSLGYQSHEGSLYYSLDFGPELNWRWDSRGRFSMRSGLADQTALSVSETLRIDHSERLLTNYLYNLNRIETPVGVSISHGGSFGLSHRLYESLTTNLGISANTQSLPGGRQNYYVGNLGFGYTKRLPQNGVLGIGLGGSLGYNDNKFERTESFVLQETHTAGTPFALPIPLNHPFVILDSIVVTKTSFGPLPVGCVAPPGPPTPLLLGRDYTLRTVGDITEIEPIPCTGIVPGINPADTIAVDYRFSVPPSLTYTTTSWNANISVDYRWIRPFFIHEQTDNRLLSGRDGRFLDNRQSDTVGTELRYDAHRISARFLGEFQHLDSTRTAYNRARSNQFVRFIVMPEMNLTLSADEAFTSFSRPSLETVAASLRAMLSYRWEFNLSSEAFVGTRFFDDSRAPAERTTEAGLRFRWSYRQVDVLPSLEFFNRRRGETDTKEIRATLRIIRRF